ncbi:unnamed protein product [Urochloa decumbens]|uniref:Uncharacterized protein n=1 Tax=Urochloa decumbens TaxID=240449 RepID=A0ABC9FR62_9POAL
MARSSSAAALLLALLVSAACLQLGSATRPVLVQQQAASAVEQQDVKHPDTVQKGTVLIPGIGRYEIGSHYIPDIWQYLHGADDTWVPNPGVEIPNPFRPGATTP